MTTMDRNCAKLTGPLMTGFAVVSFLMPIVVIPILLISVFQSKTQNGVKSTSLNTAATSFQIFGAFASVSAQSSSMYPLTYNGCFTSSTDMKDLGPSVYQTPGYCQQKCVNLNKSLIATSHRSHCWCGNPLSASINLVFDAECSSTCPPNHVSHKRKMASDNSGSDTCKTLAATVVSVWQVKSHPLHPLPHHPRKQNCHLRHSHQLRSHPMQHLYRKLHRHSLGSTQTQR